MLLLQPFYYAHTYNRVCTLGSISNVSSATPGPSVVELITFASLSWGIVVSFVFMSVLLFGCIIQALTKALCKYTIRVKYSDTIQVG